MSNYLNIPLIWPFKMVPVSSDPGVHFDDSWSHEQIKSFEMRQRYFQKWVKSETTPLIVEATYAPENLKLYRPDGTVIKEFGWTSIFAATEYQIYKTEFDVSDVTDKRVFLYQKAEAGIYSKEWFSEPIEIKTSWPGTLLFKYRNSYLSQGVAWTAESGLYMYFRCEAGLMNFVPKGDRTSFINQIRNTKQLSGYPYRNFKLWIGDVFGVPPYILDILNRIFCCDTVLITHKKGVMEKQYELTQGAEWEINEIKGYPWMGAGIEITPSTNVESTSFNDQVTAAPALVVTYQIIARFFGGQQLVQLEDIETE